MKANICRTLLSLIFSIFLVFNAFAIQGDITNISNRQYSSKTLELISEAKGSIFVVMYLISIIPGQTDTPSYKLLQELINAHKRGVKVKVILDYHKSGKYEEGQTSYHAYKMLKDIGIEVYFDTPNIYTHNKTIIIDKKFIITGSANWSNSAMTENNETNLLIESPLLAQELLGELSGIQLLTPYIQIEDSTRIPYSIMKEDGHIQKMLNQNDRLAFNTYLVLLHLVETGKEPNYETLSKWLNLPIETQRVAVHIKINRILNTLASKYNLIRFKSKINKPFQLEMLDPENPQTPLRMPISNSFKLPNSYWDFGWDKRLKLNQKVLLLVILSELGPKPIGLGLVFSIKKNSQKYGIPEWSISNGLKGLKTYNIIEVEYSDIKTDYAHRAPQTIKFLGLYNWDLLQENLKTLESQYGSRVYEKVIYYASIIYKQNDLEKIEEIINLINQYGETKVDKAFKIIAKKAPDNPKRSFRYIIGILRKLH